MNVFSLLPFMQCKHGVILMKSGLSGTLEFMGKKILFDGGAGYVEKDWGSAFPESYVWAQANQFARHDASFVFSAAKIPYAGLRFNGLISCLYESGKRYCLATYNAARILDIKVPDANTVRIHSGSGKYNQFLTLRTTGFQTLKSPSREGMDHDVKECINGRIELKWISTGGQTLFSDESNLAGIELYGDINSLF